MTIAPDGTGGIETNPTDKNQVPVNPERTPEIEKIEEEKKQLDHVTSSPAEVMEEKSYEEDEKVVAEFETVMEPPPTIDETVEEAPTGRAEVLEAARKAQDGPGATAEKAEAPVGEMAVEAPAEVELPAEEGSEDSLTMEIGGTESEVKPDLDQGVEQAGDLRKPTDTSDALDPDGAMSGDQIGEGVGLQDADRADDLLAQGKENPLDGLGKGGDSGIPGFDYGTGIQESGEGDGGAPIDPEKLDQFGEQIGDEFGLHMGPSSGAPGMDISDLPGQSDLEPWNEDPDLAGAAAPGADPRISADGEDPPPPPPPPPAPEEEDPPPPPPPPKELTEEEAKKIAADLAKNHNPDDGPLVLPKEVADKLKGKKKMTVNSEVRRISGTWLSWITGDSSDKGSDDGTGVRGTQDPEGAVATYTDIPPGVTADPMDKPLKHSDSMMQPAGDSTDGAKPRKNLKAEMSGSDVDPYAQYHGDEVDVPGGLMGDKVDVDGNLIDPPDISGGGELNTDEGVMLNTDDDENRASLEDDGSQDMKAADGNT